EGHEQRLQRLRRHDLGAQARGELDRHAHLLQVGGAAVALADVALEAPAHPRRQRALEVVGDELDQLAAGELAAQPHAPPPSWSGPHVMRTLERARCRSTRWLPSLISRAALTSSAD